jgi:hypothetical protein
LDAPRRFVDVRAAAFAGTGSFDPGGFDRSVGYPDGLAAAEPGSTAVELSSTDGWKIADALVQTSWMAAEPGSTAVGRGYFVLP